MTIAPLQARASEESGATSAEAPTKPDATLKNIGACGIEGAAIETAEVQRELSSAEEKPTKAWPDINNNIPARRKRRGRCLHTDEVLIHIDLDEIGEPDDTPTRAMVCLGCEAIRWV